MPAQAGVPCCAFVVDPGHATGETSCRLADWEE
jgi:hypothetical protein